MSTENTSYHARRAVEGIIDSLNWIVEHLTPFARYQARRRLASSDERRDSGNTLDRDDAADF